MRSRRIAIAALACAFVLIPAGTAAAGSGPAPAPSERNTTKSTAPSAEGNPMSAKAKAGGVCPDAYQIGTTGHITRDGVQIASVKQFYSPECKENYGYLWVWESFREKEDDYDVSIGIYNHDQDETSGKRSWLDSNGQEYWSNGTDTASVCTSAVGTLRPSGSALTYEAASSKRC
ncbi:hypothetical protein LHJ74_00660 [Streptomyces sp. N2-109]|uniref:Secreted protein n=1 Tax=Streptomyces gossypii TaxID=2883101 RepID=A0ABT2JLT2_9ACTN|nr:hypothetical protein [Streptomyces gossypii]MCT2588469.1 hypothetical protein [Streptomyces gossypii]